MTLKEIKEKYPKAWGKLQKLTNRNLYDFFDSEGIYVFPYDNHYGDCLRGVRFGVKVFVDNELILIGDEYGFTTRPEAEELAFTKAFEILERKIK